MHIFVLPETRNALYDLGLMLFEALHKSGVNVSISCSPSLNETDIILGAHCYKSVSDVPLGSIIFNLEHLYDDSPWLNSIYKTILKTHPVLDFSNNNVKYLHDTLGVTDVRVVTFGYTNLLKTVPCGFDIKTEGEDIDVLFYGGIYGKRAEYVAKIREAGINLILGPNCFWGKTKSNMIARAKIVLNIHLYNGGFEAPRVYHLLNNKKFVISESSINDNEYTAIADGFVRVEMGNITAMIDEIKYYLQHSAERREIANNGYKLLKSIKTRVPLN